MQLSPSPKILCQIFSAFLKSTSNFEHLETKAKLITDVPQKL